MIREEQIQAAGDAAGIWTEAAFQALKFVARTQQNVFVDDVTKHFSFPPPNDRRAWGAVWLRAIRQGLIEKTSEFRQSKELENSRAESAKHFPVYRSLIYNGDKT